MFTIEKWNLQTIRKEGELCQQKIGQVLLHICRARQGAYGIRIFTEKGTKVLVDQFENAFVKQRTFYWAVTNPTECLLNTKLDNYRIMLLDKYFIVFDNQTGIVLGIGDKEGCSDFLDYAYAN